MGIARIGKNIIGAPKSQKNSALSNYSFFQYCIIIIEIISIAPKKYIATSHSQMH